MVAQLIVQPQRAPLEGAIPVPDDEQVALGRIALAALCRGKTTLALARPSGSVQALLTALGLLGIKSDAGEGTVAVWGVGLSGGHGPDLAIDVRGELHVAALLLGLCAGRPFFAELWVDDIVASMLLPFLQESHGIQADSLPEDVGMRVVCSPRAQELGRPGGVQAALSGVHVWAKQALLLAGLRAQTPSMIEEAIASPDHLERAFLRARAPLQEQGTVLELHPPRDDDALSPQTYQSIGSASLAVPLCAAALMVEGSQVRLRNVVQNPTRLDFFHVCRLSGAELGLQPHGDLQGEPVGDFLLRFRKLRAMDIGGEPVVRLADDVLYLFAMAPPASSPFLFRDIVIQGRGGDVRVVGRAMGLLRSSGFTVGEQDGAVCIEAPPGPLHPLNVTTGGDPRLALLATILALRASKQSVIDDVDCLRAHFPRWVGTLRALGATVEVREA